MKHRARTGRAVLTGAAMAAFCAGAQAADGVVMSPVTADLSRLSLEELANVEIMSVSKRPERLAEAPAAVYVITGDDIRRSAATSLPEALRLAPNLQVLRVDSGGYAISARGFNGFETSNKLLVMVDGRSIYTPFHSGVLWDEHQVMLDDLERVEVVSGPGGALWGANAVNGVVNVISKSAHDTQGLLFEARRGDIDRSGSVRYGGPLGEAGAWRAYAMGFDRRDSLLPGGAEAGDGWQGGQTGFRTDFDAGGGGATVQGDAYYHRHDDGGRLNGGNVLGRWRREWDGGGGLEAQVYFDRTDRYGPPLGAVVPSVAETVETWDVQVQQVLAPHGRHRLVVGGGYRIIDDEFLVGDILDAGGAPLPNFAVDPTARRLQLANLFIQDEIALTDALSLTLGLKLEDSSYSGLDYLPSARLAWRASETTLLWAAVSRAVRTPSRVERDLTYPGIIVGGVFDRESVVAYEAGWRGRVGERVNFSVSAFFNDYMDLRTNEMTNGGFPVFVGNGREGQTWGLEAWGGYAVMDGWRLSAGLSTLRKDFQTKAGHVDIAYPVSTGNDPEHQLLLRSQSNLSDRLELDLMLRAVDELPSPQVDAHVELDARIGWRVTQEAELYLAGVNLLDDQRREAGDPDYVNEVRRSIYAGLRWSF